VITDRAHWQNVYAQRASEEVSWYEPRPLRSLDLIAAAGVARDAGILDVGGGASTLVGELLKSGYVDLTVADISPAALARTQAQLGSRVQRVKFVEADIRSHEFGRCYALWHDRAVFHFMVDEHDRDQYLSTLHRTLEPGGHAIVATFGPDGPTRCSGLPVQRYDADKLALTLGPEFEVRTTRLHAHRTPMGATQQFLYLLAHRNGEL